MRISTSGCESPNYSVFNLAENVADTAFAISGVQTPSETFHGYEGAVAAAHVFTGLITASVNHDRGNSSHLWAQASSEGIKAAGAAVMAAGSTNVGAVVYGCGILASLATNFISD